MLYSKKPSYIKDVNFTNNGTTSEVLDKSKAPEYASFNEWRERGYSVMKGEKANIRENGVPLFHRDQVKYTSKCYGLDDDGYGGYDDDGYFDYF